MKSVTALLASTMLLGAIAVGNAQNTSPPLPSETPQNQGAQRNPDGTPGGSKIPSPPNADRAGSAPLDQGNANQDSSGSSTTGRGGGVVQPDPETPRSGSTPGR